MSIAVRDRMELVVVEEDDGLRGLDQAGRREFQQVFIEYRAKGWSLRKIASDGDRPRGGFFFVGA